MDISYCYWLSIKTVVQTQFQSSKFESDWKLRFIKRNCKMLQTLLYLAVTITVVYSDCCTILPHLKLCSDEDIECHIKQYRIHCCNDSVKTALGPFADIFIKIVS